MTRRRRFVVRPTFFDELDGLLPLERTASGVPSASDFILHDLTTIVETLASDFEGSTMPVPDTDERVLLCTGTTVPFVSLSVRLASDDTVEVISVDLDLG